MRYHGEMSQARHGWCIRLFCYIIFALVCSYIGDGATKQHCLRDFLAHVTEKSPRHLTIFHKQVNSNQYPTIQLYTEQPLLSEFLSSEFSNYPNVQGKSGINNGLVLPAITEKWWVQHSIY